jgi:ATP-binding cassette subfamily F protein uup
MNYLSAENLSKSYGDQKLFEEITFGLSKGDKTALIARNGTGKTTLLRILAGKESSDTGEFTFRNGIKVAFLEQVPELDESLTIDELILSANSHMLSVIHAYEKALNKHSELHSDVNSGELESASAEMDRLHAWDYERRLRQMLDLFRITRTDQLVAKLSGGEKKRLAMALVLLDEPDFLILDEPTNHLDIDMIEWLEDYLSRSTLTLLMVTHDRYFLDRVCNRIFELSLGNLFVYQGNYEHFLEKRAAREDLRKVEAHRAGRLMKRELEWLRRMPKARTGKSKSRIDAFDKIEARAKLVEEGGELILRVKSPRMGGKILELENLDKAFGDLSIIRDFSYKFAKGERLGVIGRNGTGKTTFLNLIAGVEDADTGKVITGETIVQAYYRQMVPLWKEDQLVIDAVKDIAEVVSLEDGRTISASKFLEHFMFSPEAQYKRIAKLSGGELRRLHLLTVLIRNPNFLILDEPTNDLDLFALNKLEEFLLAFKGCLVIVSHDRYFLDKLTDHLFVFEGEGTIRDHYGSYADYRSLHQKAGGAPSKPGDAQSVAVEQDPSPVKKTAKSKPGGPKTKLSYKEQQEYDNLEPEIATLEEEKALLEEEIAAGNLDYEELNQKSIRISRLMDLIEAKMQRWIELGQYL